MGWKASLLVIKRPRVIDNLFLLKELGFNGLLPIENEPFETAINPEANKAFIGSYKDNLLICAPGLPFQLFKQNETSAETKLKELFPNSEICSIVLNSILNLWGYLIIAGGKKLRMKAGSADDGTFFDIGVPLDEEKDLLEKSKIDVTGRRVYFLDQFPDEPITEDQVGEALVFSVSKRYFGTELNRVDESLFEMELRGFSFSSMDELVIQQSSTKIPRWLKVLILAILIAAALALKNLALKSLFSLISINPNLWVG